MTDVALPEEPVPAPATRELDSLVDKLADHKECLKMIDFWTDRARKIASEISTVMGDATIGTVNGEPVVTYNFVERFRGKDFMTDYPDMYRLFTHEVAKTQFDLDLFRQSRPDLYEKYRVRALRNGF